MAVMYLGCSLYWLSSRCSRAFATSGTLKALNLFLCLSSMQIQLVLTSSPQHRLLLPLSGMALEALLLWGDHFCLHQQALSSQGWTVYLVIWTHQHAGADPRSILGTHRLPVGFTGTAVQCWWSYCQNQTQQNPKQRLHITGEERGWSPE